MKPEEELELSVSYCFLVSESNHLISMCGSNELHKHIEQSIAYSKC